MRTEVYLPEEVVAHAKAMVRPHRTGAQRSLSVGIVLQAMVRAIDSLPLEVEMDGINQNADDELAERFRRALHAWAATLTTSGAQSTNSQP